MDPAAAREKIRKLRALASDRGATEHEREAARLAIKRIEAKCPASAFEADEQGTPCWIDEAVYVSDDDWDTLRARTDELNRLFHGPKAGPCRICRGTGRIKTMVSGSLLDFGPCPHCTPPKKK